MKLQGCLNPKKGITLQGTTRFPSARRLVKEVQHFEEKKLLTAHYANIF